MSNAQLEAAIEAAWNVRDEITPSTTGEARDAIEDTLNALDAGRLRVAERGDDGTWHVNQWAKKAVLLGFRLKDMELQEGSPQGAAWWDKVRQASGKAGTTTGGGAAGFRGRAQLRRAQVRLHRAGRRSDAVLRQSRRLC